jgi:putative ABC transport system permease protein
MLAWKDFVHEWRVSLCLVLALAAVLTPLLVLFGLKSGLVTALTDRLKADPATREVVVLGNGRLPAGWFAALAGDPATGFVAPRTRSLAATIDLLAADDGKGGGRRVASAVEMVPTGPGDPLLSGLPAPSVMGPAVMGEAVLSAAAARRLGVTAGARLTAARLTAVVPRTVGERREAASTPLSVLAVLPEAALAREAVLVPVPLLVAAEDFRDGYAVPELGWPGERPAPPRLEFASARLYARDMDGVAPLAARLTAEGLEVRTRAAEIEQVRAIDRVLSVLFAVIAGIGASGFVLALAASLWANVDRKRKELALLRLMGFTTAPLAAVPAVQAALVALLGAALSLLWYLAVAVALNGMLSANLARDELVCRLPPGPAAVACLATLALAVLASSVAAIRAARIEPSVCLREM